VQDPDKVDAKLRTILFKKKHSFSLDYQIFSDANWEVPQGYWNGDIVFEMQAEMDDHMVGDFMPELSDSPLGEPSRANLTEDRFEVSVKRELESVKQRLEYAKGKARIPLWVRLVELTANDHRMRSAGVALLKAALIEYPNNPDLVRILAAVLIREKALGDARFFLYRVLEKNDGIPELYYHLACAEALANRPFEAIGALESALILNPFYAENAVSDPNLASLRFRSDFRKLTSLAVC
jgi:predicted Zn-dependent protease